MRRRKLPAEQAVWLVIGMGLFRDRSIQAIAQHLDLVLPEPNAKGTARPHENRSQLALFEESRPRVADLD